MKTQPKKVSANVIDSASLGEEQLVGRVIRTAESTPGLVLDFAEQFCISGASEPDDAVGLAIVSVEQLAALPEHFQSPVDLQEGLLILRNALVGVGDGLAVAATITAVAAIQAGKSSRDTVEKLLSWYRSRTAA